MRDPLTKINENDWRCRMCGATVKPGQTHYALKPKPHASLAALIVSEYLDPDEVFSMRYLASEIEDKAVRDTIGRRVKGGLEFDAVAGCWRES